MAKIFRGGYQNNHPEVLELPAGAAGILPGNLLQRTANELVVHATAGNRLYVADAPPCYGSDYVYADGETVMGYIPASREVYSVRIVAGVTAAADAPLYSDGAGSLTATDPGPGDPVVGHLVSAVTASSAGDLVDMRIA